MPHPILGNHRRVTRLFRYIAILYDHVRPLFAGFEETRDRYFAELDLESTDRILDVGCGTGESMRRVAGAGRDVHGVDVSPHQLQHARGKDGLENATLALGDATRLPYRSGTFDVVISIGSLPYVPDVDAALEAAHRVTKPGGQLFVVGPKYPANPVARRVADALLHFLRPEEFAARCQAAGWADIDTTTVHMDWLARDALVVTARAR